ncbi:hypothetical protein BKA70DRAFT_1441431 [Coprinopsis sp. MPI-PUGE-AT-0042]|nr:hypothetical protein BKA70DRAFT_1441431 [Coprinopsis sp. MPI-PUGE-AT-0042]
MTIPWVRSTKHQPAIGSRETEPSAGVSHKRRSRGHIRNAPSPLDRQPQLSRQSFLATTHATSPRLNMSSSTQNLFDSLPKNIPLVCAPPFLTYPPFGRFAIAYELDADGNERLLLEQRIQHYLSRRGFVQHHNSSSIIEFASTFYVYLTMVNLETAASVPPTKLKNLTMYPIQELATLTTSQLLRFSGSAATVRLERQSSESKIQRLVPSELQEGGGGLVGGEVDSEDGVIGEESAAIGECDDVEEDAVLVSASNEA